VTATTAASMEARMRAVVAAHVFLEFGPSTGGAHHHQG
jgi:hypothetical protein